MTDNHTFPVMADVEKLRDYFEWLVQNGKGKYRVEMREHYIALPPMLMDSACDDDARVAFLIGVH